MSICIRTQHTECGYGYMLIDVGISNLSILCSSTNISPAMEPHVFRGSWGKAVLPTSRERAGNCTEIRR